MQQQDNNPTVAAWQILFGEDDPFIDYTKPENQPRLNALRQKKFESLKIFRDGPGKPLFDQWKEKIKRDTLVMLSGTVDCNCKVCQKVREIQFLLGMILQIEIFLSEGSKQTQIGG